MLALIAHGLTNLEIAAALYLSINSIKSYIRGAYRRIDARTRPQVFLWALKHGFGTDPHQSCPGP